MSDNYQYISTQLYLNAEYRAQNQELHDVIQQILSNGLVSSGNTYIRWGRTTCPSETGARILYNGYAGGSFFSHTGGGSNYLCLPQNPDLVNVVGGYRSYMHGAEYQTGAGSDHPLASLHDQEVPCVVCYTPNTNVVMVPAKTTCQHGLALEYSGYLMSSYHQHSSRTNYVCIDGEAEALDDSHGNQDGALFYFVEGQCGSLPCGPYIDGYELTCAVCSLPPTRTNSGL